MGYMICIPHNFDMIKIMGNIYCKFLEAGRYTNVLHANNFFNKVKKENFEYLNCCVSK
jgi:hypothetical protein